MSSTYASRAPALRPRRRVLVAAALGLAALVGLATWSLVDRFAGGGGATEDAVVLVDRFNEAVNAADTNGAEALIAKTVVMVSLGETYRGSDAVVRQLIRASRVGLRVERIAPVSVAGRYWTTFDKYTAPGGESGVMLAVFEVRAKKIVRIWGMRPPVTPPFGNDLVG